jgi:hypothetical protein
MGRRGAADAGGTYGGSGVDGGAGGAHRHASVTVGDAIAGGACGTDGTPMPVGESFHQAISSGTETPSTCVPATHPLCGPPTRRSHTNEESGISHLQQHRMSVDHEPLLHFIRHHAHRR